MSDVFMGLIQNYVVDNFKKAKSRNKVVELRLSKNSILKIYKDDSADFYNSKTGKTTKIKEERLKEILRIPEDYFWDIFDSHYEYSYKT
jgi:hypothetical protein